LAYVHKREYDRAIPDFDQALRLTPNDADAFDNRGWAYAHKGDYKRAIQDYDQAIRLNASLADALHNRSLAYAHEGDYLRAMADRAHFLWLKFGIVGSVIRLCILAFVVALALGFKRFRKGPVTSPQS
jgi:tetratricopeptide (TPR) repeat protein